MKEKISTTLIIRRIIQVIAFILIPGLFASSLNAIQSIIMMLVNMQLNASQLLGDLLLLAVTIIPTIIFGRYFCGYFCSFGLMQDVFSTIGKYTIKFKKRIPKSIDHILKYMKYVVLGGLIVLWVFHIDYGKGPWEVFANYLSLSSWKDLSSFMTWGGFVLILVIISSLFYERVFCRYLCPMGAIYALLSPMHFFKKYKPTEKCRSCKLCSMTCPMHNISLKPDKHIVTAASTAAIASLYYAGTILPATLPTSSTITSQAASANLKDGTYTGSGQGFRGTTSVKVVVSNKKISSITVTSYQDDEQYFSRAKTSI
ncbi:4Fe-4S binding protein, partial [Sharpea azabuensis]|uniref:4Fe-4S binding protein n=1 Tax=Sharpea azabuensis TaxID=322505 RepID=UPI00156A1D9E